MYRLTGNIQFNEPGDSICPAVERICSSVRARFKFDLRLVLLSFSRPAVCKEDDDEEDGIFCLKTTCGESCTTLICPSDWTM